MSAGDFSAKFERLMSALEVPGLKIPAAGVKIFNHDTPIPEAIRMFAPDNVSVTSCQAFKQSSLGDVVLLTRDNIGCIAAAITFGLVDQDQAVPMQGSRVYTDIMKEQSGHEATFTPPTPHDFTSGNVYACRESGKSDFCLFGSEESGRFVSREVARKAIAEMTAIQPPTTEGIFLFTPEFDEIRIAPDVVVLDVRPVELTRILQGYQYLTGERVTGSMGPVRVVNSDLIVRPYLTGTINFSSYCIGARLIAQYSPNRLGLGIPYPLFETVVRGVEESQTGYPFPQYPGAGDQGS